MDHLVKKLSAASKLVLADAEKVADSFNIFLGGDVLLLGLLQTKDKATRTVLSTLGINVDQVQTALEATLIENQPLFRGAAQGWTSTGAMSVEWGLEEAKKVSLRKVTPEFLLIGLLMHGGGRVTEVLAPYSVTWEKALIIVRKLHNRPLTDEEFIALTSQLEEEIADCRNQITTHSNLIDVLKDEMKEREARKKFLAEQIQERNHGF